MFAWILNDARIDNPFLYDTFNVANNKKLTDCHLEVGNGTQYQEVEYTPSTDVSRVYRDVMNISMGIMISKVGRSSHVPMYTKL